ncbi:MAG: hypothetical protein M3O50_14920 [Myxococcota bacterium]|nr:hypothetical protein [Myxococcota bacterium]
MTAQVAFFGFGMSDQAHPTRITAQVLSGSRLPDFVEPQIRVAVAKPMQERNAPAFHSGMLTNGDALNPEKAFAPGVEGVERSTRQLSQGILEITWPARSEGKRCLIEVRESEIGCGQPGRLLVGLLNVADPANQVWL